MDDDYAFRGPFDAWMTDEEVEALAEKLESQYSGCSLEHLPPAPREPRRVVMQSADPDYRICVHELARTLEQYARKQYVPLYEGEADFETAASEMLEFILAERCSRKGR